MQLDAKKGSASEVWVARPEDVVDPRKHLGFWMDDPPSVSYPCMFCCQCSSHTHPTSWLASVSLHRLRLNNTSLGSMYDAVTIPGHHHHLHTDLCVLFRWAQRLGASRRVSAESQRAKLTFQRPSLAISVAVRFHNHLIITIGCQREVVFQSNPERDGSHHET